MDLADLVRLTNRGMIAFDLALGAGAIAAPEATLHRLGHEAPSDDAKAGLRFAGAFNLGLAAGCAALARRRR